MLKHTYHVIALLAVLAFAGCTGIGPSVTQPAVSQQAAIDAAWQDLDPVTSSHNRANFESVDSRRVAGSEIVERFKDTKTNTYCWGTKIPANAVVEPSTTYWYVVLRRRAMTALPVTRVSPTQPPAIPDAKIYEAYFAIDFTTGQVVARQIPCVVF